MEQVGGPLFQRLEVNSTEAYAKIILSQGSRKLI